MSNKCTWVLNWVLYFQQTIKLFVLNEYFSMLGNQISLRVKYGTSVVKFVAIFLRHWAAYQVDLDERLLN